MSSETQTLQIFQKDLSGNQKARNAAKEPIFRSVLLASCVPGFIRDLIIFSLFAVTISACAPPQPPPEPPAESLPPLESAASCAPNGSTPFAQSEFYFADLELGGSCTAFLEQEECVLAIYDDCNWEKTNRTQYGARQWIGRTEPLGADRYRVRMSAVNERPPATLPPRGCAGELTAPATPEARVYLDCDGAGFHDFYLEKKNPTAAPWGSRDESARITVAITSNPSFDSMPELALVTAGDRRELWTVVNWDSGPDVGGVYAYAIGSENHTAERVAAIDRPQRIGVDQKRGLALVAQREQNDSIGRLHLIDLATRAVRTSTTLDGEIRKIVALEDRWVVGRFDAALRGPVVEALAPEDLRGIGAPVTLRGERVADMVAVSSTSGVALIVATLHGDRESELFGLDAQLHEVWSTPVHETNVEGLIALNGDRAAFVAGASNRYHELAVASGEVLPPIPVAIFDGLHATAYDARADRVFVISRWGGTSYLDRSLGRVAQTNSSEMVEQSAAVWDAETSTLFVLQPERGRIATIRER